MWAHFVCKTALTFVLYKCQCESVAIPPFCFNHNFASAQTHQYVVCSLSWSPLLCHRVRVRVSHELMSPTVSSIKRLVLTTSISWVPSGFLCRIYLSFLTLLFAQTEGQAESRNAVWMQLISLQNGCHSHRHETALLYINPVALGPTSGS